MSLFGDILIGIAGAVLAFFTFGTAVALIVGFGIGFGAGELFKLFLPKPEVSASSLAGSQVYSVNNQQNAQRIGQPQAVIYGLVRRWPELLSQPWSEYKNNDQILHQWMRLSVGIAKIDDIRIGDAAAYSFPGFDHQLFMPSEPMTSFHPDVYTHAEVSNIEFAGGALVSQTFTGSIIFAPTGYPGRIDHDGGSGVFDGAPVGTSVEVTGAGAGYDGTYTILAQDSTNEWVDTSATFTAATINCTVRWSQYDSTDSDVKLTKDVALVFDNTLSQITAVTTEDNPNDLSVFAIGDQITPIDDPSGANKNVTFKVVGVSNGGLSLIVTPPPTSLSGISTVVLLRRYHGPYVGCPPGTTIDRVQVDVIFPNGLGWTNLDSGDFLYHAVDFDLQWQQIDDAGSPLSDWQSLGEYTINDRSRTPVRRTIEFDMPTPCRAQFKHARVSKDSTRTEAIDAAQWTGLKGFIVTPAGEDYRVDENSTTLAVSVRASGTLANGSDKKINCLVQRWLETYDADTQTWLAPEPTQAVVWALLDKLRGPYTRKDRQVADNRIDLTALLSLHATLEAEGVQFNGAFETESTLLDNANEILRLGRARLTYDWQQAKFSVYRDDTAAPMQAFSDNNSRLTSYKLSALTSNSPTGVQVSYQDPTAWEERIVGFPYNAAASELSGGERPLKVDMRHGCTQRQIAWEEAAYEWNATVYRNRELSLDAELEPVLLKRGDRLLIQNRERKWGWGAKVRAAAGRTLTVWPPVEWLAGAQHYVYLRGPDGTPGAKINCSRGSSDDVLVLDSDPDVEITGDAAGEEQTHVLFGRSGDEPQIMILNECAWSLADSGGQQASLAGVLEDERVLANPGPVYADPDAVDPTAPVLEIDGLVATATGLTVTATWETINDSLIQINAAGDTAQINATGDDGLYRVEYDGEFIYEISYRYVGDLDWNVMLRTNLTTATFAVSHTGDVQVGVEAIAGPLLGDTSIYTLTVS